MEKLDHANSNHKQTGVALLITDKIDFKTTTTKNVTRDKEEHFIMIKGSILQETIMIINIFAHLITYTKS